MTNTTYTIRRNPAKYANLHSCDPAYWRMFCDYGQPQSGETLVASIEATYKLLSDIINVGAFKPENIEAATELRKVVKAESDKLAGATIDETVLRFVAYQLERYALRIWYRDTRAARQATRPAPAKQEKAKAPAKQEKPKAKAPAKQEIAKANEATFVSKLTKAQKRDLVLGLLSELLK